MLPIARAIRSGKSLTKTIKMSKNATLEQVRQRVLDRRATLSDEVVSVKSLMMDPGQPSRMIVRRPGSTHEDSYAFDSRCYNQAPSVVYGLPGAYLKTLLEGDKGDPQLAALNFNHWVNVSKEREVLLRFREKDGEKILRAIKPGTWNPIPYEASLETLITKFGAEKEATVTRFDDDGLVLDFISHRLKYNRDTAQVGDPIEWGFRFRDSDVGQGDLQIGPYTRRLRCTNGATSITKGVIMSLSHSSKEARVLEQIQSNIRQGVEMISGYAARVEEQLNASIDIMLKLNPETNEPDSALVRLARDEAVTRLEDKYVREAWKVEGESIKEPSVFRLHNAFTRAGTHGEELTDDQKLHLQAVGGRILELAVQADHHWN